MYVIRGKYPGQPWEDIDSFHNKKEAEDMLEEYRRAFGKGWLFCIKRRADR